MNKTIFTGRLTADPQIVTTQSGKQVARYTLAVDRNKDETDFIRCAVFGKGAEFAEKYLRKGVKVAIVGRLQTGSYTDKDGIKRESWQIIVDQHEFCESKREEVEDIPSIEDELPFM